MYYKCAQPLTIFTLHSMMKILLVIVLVLFLNLINVQSEYCYNGDLNIKNRTDDSQGTEFGTYETVSGVLEICYNNSYSNICLNVNATEVARIACNYFGYYGKCFYLLIDLSILFIYNYHSADTANGFATFGSRNNTDLVGSIDCPPYAYGFYDCNLGFIAAKDCSLDQDLYIYCRRCKSCNYMKLNDKYFILYLTNNLKFQLSVYYSH